MKTCDKDTTTISRIKIATKTLHELTWHNNIRRKTKDDYFIIENFFHEGNEMWPLTTKWRDKIPKVELDCMGEGLQLTKTGRSMQ